MDIEMPVLNGVEATLAIRAREQSEGEKDYLPILGVTGKCPSKRAAKSARR